MLQASSAICFNAGAQCDGPDGRGVYGDCESHSEADLWLIDRYIDFLLDHEATAGKRVTMIPLVGVSPDGSIEYRTWRAGIYPAGDVLPTQAAAGIDADDLNYSFGAIGPGCIAETEIGDFLQALPPIRIREVCEAVGAADQGTCCMGSICDPTFSGALDCLLDAASPA